MYHKHMLPKKSPVARCAVDAIVSEIVPICAEHIAITIDIDDFVDTQPGQFLQLICHASDQRTRSRSWRSDECPSPQQTADSPRAFLRRPFSIADHTCDDAGKSRITIISRAVGVGTRYLSQLRKADVLNITGPIGTAFRIPDHDPPLVLVGGGVGIPPLLYLARRLFERGHTHVTLFFGATRAEHLPLRLFASPDTDGRPLPCATLPGGAPFPTVVTTDDGSIGVRGVVTDALARWHDSFQSGATRPIVYACGPEGMLHAVSDFSRRWRLPCQLCIERYMGCGLGTCLSCVVRVSDASRAASWRWALACQEGPVMDREVLCAFSRPYGSRVGDA